VSVPVVSARTTLDVWMDGLGDHTLSEDERLVIFSMYYDIDPDHEGSNAVTKTVVATGAAAAMTAPPAS